LAITENEKNERQIKKKKGSDVKSRAEVAQSGAENSKIDYKKKGRAREGEVSRNSNDREIQSKRWDGGGK